MKVEIKSISGIVMYIRGAVSVRDAVEQLCREGADLTRASLSGANLSGADLTRASLSESDLSWANLSESDLSESDLSGANLSRANLSRANLSKADLTRASLSESDLTRTDLSESDLSGANLSGANLTRTDLSGADLTRTDLSESDLSRANLSRANLSRANLSRASLSGANLSRADLTGANGSDLAIARTRILPDGDLIGWKKCMDGVIVRLRVPARAERSHALGRKCRAEFVEVLEVIGAEVGVSCHDRKTQYRVGEAVCCDKWEEDWRVECGGGIHFFITRAEAEAY